jgi:predicted GNAT family N-acyltransferase
MTSPTIAHLRPPGASILAYNANFPPTAQPSPLIPQPFLDAMLIRTAVFVGEQGVPMPREHDADDARSHHWVAYADPSPPPAAAEPESAPRATADAAAEAGPPRDRGGDEGDARPSLGRDGGGAAGAAARRPVGTIRAVPPSHGPGALGGGGGAGVAPPEWPPHPTVHEGEAYVRLGRLATLPGRRGEGVAGRLVETVLGFLAQAGAGAEMLAGEEAGEAAPRWKGLVVVHAQRDRSVAFWRRFGFVVDEGMGEWDEEGMVHVGMYRKVDVAGQEGGRDPASVHAWLLDRWDENVI